MRKEVILEKLEKIFYEKSFSDVSMQYIANYLDIRKASVYYYFSSKERLIKDVLNYSFDNYKIFIKNLPTNNLKNLIYDFIKFPNKSKNVFSVITQKWYCNKQELKDIIQEKQKDILELLYLNLITNYKFSKEKSFLFISLLDDLSKKRCIFGDCDMNIKSLINEIIKIF